MLHTCLERASVGSFDSPGLASWQRISARRSLTVVNESLSFDSSGSEPIAPLQGLFDVECGPVK
jgi:hypothetical protein